MGTVRIVHSENRNIPTVKKEQVSPYKNANRALVIIILSKFLKNTKLII